MAEPFVTAADAIRWFVVWTHMTRTLSVEKFIATRDGFNTYAGWLDELQKWFARPNSCVADIHDYRQCIPFDGSIFQTKCTICGSCGYL